MTLSKEQISYLIGFLHADGHLYETTRNRGKLSIEVDETDNDIIIKVQNLIGGTIRKRNRETNFGQNSSVILTQCGLETRKFLKSKGMIAGKKSLIISAPSKLSFNHYLRGYFDGDGSLGFTKNNEPFISFCVSSEKLKDQILTFLNEKLGITKNLKRNKRDKVYNIVVKNEGAIGLGKLMYKRSSIFLDRKKKKFNSLLKWKRTKKIGNRH